MAESGTISKISEKVKEVTGNESKEISDALDENKMYDYVYEKLESEYPKFADISIDWKTSIQKNGGTIKEHIVKGNSVKLLSTPEVEKEKADLAQKDNQELTEQSKMLFKKLGPNEQRKLLEEFVQETEEIN